MISDYSEKIPCDCKFLLPLEMNTEIFCQVPTRTKGHDVKLQKQQKPLTISA